MSRVAGLVGFLAAPLFLAVAVVFALAVRRPFPARPRLVWGITPVISYSYWSRAMREAGYTSETLTDGYYASINRREDWDVLLDERFPRLPAVLRRYIGFLDALRRYDVFFLSFDGFLLSRTRVRRYEARLLRLAGKKSVVLPYGGDSYVYRRVRSSALMHALMLSYPHASRVQDEIAERVDYWTEHADVVIQGCMAPDGFGRSDVLTPSYVCLDVRAWRPTSRASAMADGRNGRVVVAHAPNHRGFKGSEFVIAAVEALRNEGLDVDLRLFERVPNAEVKRALENEVDVLVEQIIAPVHGLNALEGMAAGLPVVSNLEDDDYVLPLRRWGFFDECPLVSGSPETIVDVLRALVTRPDLRAALGRAGRAYVEKYHGYDSAQHLFGEVLRFLAGERRALADLYHPLHSEWVRRSPRIEPPLERNRIV